jgi:hypothetical protein
MKTIEYRATFTDPLHQPFELVRVHARSINSGYAKALKEARKPLGSGEEREILGIEFWQVLA